MAKDDEKAAYQRLHDAMQHNQPACAGDKRFINDTHPNGEREELEATCRRCPIRGACTAYASIAKPKGGYWPIKLNKKEETP